MKASSPQHPPQPSKLRITVHNRIDDAPAWEWNALARADNPFLSHEFLAALEHSGCVGREAGWLPVHLTARNPAGQLLGAVPMYLKDNSYGEYVFDWGWADAFHRSGIPYYPKLVAAAPFTPATGPRLLLGAHADPDIGDQLIAAALELVERTGASSLHWLFTTEEQTAALEKHGLMRRTGCQYHWEEPRLPGFQRLPGAVQRPEKEEDQKGAPPGAGSGSGDRAAGGASGRGSPVGGF